jgi:hypothetical protein
MESSFYRTEVDMIGSGCFLTLLLLTASPQDAGVVTVSDQTSVTETELDSIDGEAAAADYVGPSTEDDDKEVGKSLVVLQAMMQEKKGPVNPFKEEESVPGEAIAEPPSRLPPVQANPSHPALPDAAFAGDYGSQVNCCPADSCPTCGCQCRSNNTGQIAFHNWFSDITYDAWVDQGVTLNMFSPRNRSNFPVGFNNRSNEYQLNQLYLRLQRKVHEQGGRWDIGGTVDLLYGTDSFYASSRGLEVDQNFGHKWNAQQYGLAMPQCYLEVFAPWGDDGLSMKLGHFYTILGYETTPAPENFFYSHSLCLIYGEPVTETGLLGEKKLGNFKIQAGVTRGWDNWEDNNNDLSFLGGLSWTEDDGCSSLAFAIQSGPEQNEPPESNNFRNVLSLVYQQKLGEQFQYVLQYDYGREDRGDNFRLRPGKWVGLDQYLFYTINECWKAGVRFEWFQDRDGLRLTGGRQGADYYELTAGLNWTPNSRVVVRPEIRYDWDGTPNYTPYADASRSSQLLLDCDVIVKF